MKLKKVLGSTVSEDFFSRCELEIQGEIETAVLFAKESPLPTA